MAELSFVAALGLALAALFVWAFGRLPRDRFQMLAAVPLRRTSGGAWKGANLTWYGLLSASAYAFGAMAFFFLAGAAGVDRTLAMAFGLVLLALGMAAARGVARLVEGKRHALTVGGASFVVLLAAPLAVLAVRAWSGEPARLPALPALAALAVAYVYGEGVGRLACISFGCCYGKPVAEAGRVARRLFGRCHFTFSGDTKKIAYAAGLAGVPVVPIQALTAAVLVALGLGGTLLFLAEAYGAAFLLAVAGSQAWRVASETLRADDRGGGRHLSAYQAMALLAIPAALAVVWALPEEAAPPADLAAGLAALWDPAMILLLELVWVTAFFYTGVSKVTGSVLSFRVYRSRI